LLGAGATATTMALAKVMTTAAMATTAAGHRTQDTALTTNPATDVTMAIAPGAS
jgi:hypothetical protein